MPTAAKLFSAFWFALAGWLAANAHVPALGEGFSTGMFREFSALIGLFCGWRVLGNGVGSGYADAISAAFKTAVILVFFALLLFSGYQMIRRALHMRYDGPLESLLGWVGLMVKNLLTLGSVGVIGVLVLAVLIGGTLAEKVARRWG